MPSLTSGIEGLEWNPFPYRCATPEDLQPEALPEPGEEEVAVVLGDMHVPYECPEAVAVAREVVREVQPDLLVLNGDTIDFFQISRFSSDPKRRLDLQKDLDRARRLLAGFRQAAPAARMVFRVGNHEARLDHWRSHHPEVGVLDCLQLESLLDLPALRCEFLGEREPLSWHGWTITHGDLCRKRAGYTAQGMIENYGTSGISNHVHRLAMVERRTMHTAFVWIENGCLAQLKPEYSEIADWAHGLSVLTHHDGEVWAEPVRIKDGRALFRGRRING